MGTGSLSAGQRDPASPWKESRATHTRAWCEQNASGRQRQAGPGFCSVISSLHELRVEGGSLRPIISSKVRSQTAQDNVAAYLPFRGFGVFQWAKERTFLHL